MRISIDLHDDQMQRTLFHERLIDTLRRNPRFIPDPRQADVLFPAEDISVEQHWPRYGDQRSAYVRGGFFEQSRYESYLSRIAQSPGTWCLVSMHPMFRLPQCFKDRNNIIIADANLSAWERALNPRTISMPALPITRGPGRNVPRTILASFRGVISHPVRQSLAALHDGSRIICEAVESSNHIGRIDALAGATDARYVELLERSIFALAPRGDALYSYRFTEALSFGCIPVVLSDGWVLPFDHTIAWTDAAVIVPESCAGHTPALLATFPPGRIAGMMSCAGSEYSRRLSSLDAIVETLLGEVEVVLAHEGISARVGG